MRTHQVLCSAQPDFLLPLEMGGADPDPSGEQIPDYDDYSDGGSSDD